MKKISKTYQDLNNTLYPDSIDEYPKWADPSSSDVILIKRYEELYEAGNIIEATAILDQNPHLKNIILSASNLNNLRDSVLALERWYKYHFEDYLANHVKQICISESKPTSQLANDIWYEKLK